MVLSGWRRALKLRISVPSDDDGDPSVPLPSPSSSSSSGRTPSLKSLINSRSSPASLRVNSTTGSTTAPARSTTCAICLETMKPGHGHALFTAECSHSFHFSCIANNVRHGSLICPVCRATWKEVPWEAPQLNSGRKSDFTASTNVGAAAVGSAPVVNREQQPPRRSLSSARTPEDPMLEALALRDAEEEQRRLEPVLRMLDESIASFRSETKQAADGPAEPARFDDDEALLCRSGIDYGVGCGVPAIEITSTAEEVEVRFCEERENMTVLVHVQGATRKEEQRRAAVDLVAVLDVSGSMAGPKLALLKQAMRLVIRSLGSDDRLCVVTFSSRARRVIPLRRMSMEGRRAAMEAVDALTCSGGTSISDGLAKGTAVLKQRRHRNAVTGIMLLSDGQDSFTMRSPTAPGGVAFPVHTFGLGVDHDASTLHSVAEESGGTFSFIQAEGLVQDAFAQCLGGLLSVVAVQAALTLHVPETAPPATRITNLEAGSYVSSVSDGGRFATVFLSDLYADEERDILVSLRVPPLSNSASAAPTLQVSATYTDPVSGAACSTSTAALSISRPTETSSAPPCIILDRQRNRLQAVQAMIEARSLADSGDLDAAQRRLEAARQRLRSSVASNSGDRLSASLDLELARIQATMNNRHVYQTCGRAYALSAQSCHLRQRATTRASCRNEEVEGYRTPYMMTMLMHSRAGIPELAALRPPTPPAAATAAHRRHIVEPRPGSRISRLASFDSVVEH